MGGGILGGWGRVGRHLIPPNQFTGVRGIWVFIRRGETDPLLAAFTCSMNKLQLHHGRNSRQQQHTTLLRIQRTVWSGSVNLWFVYTLIRCNLQYCYHTLLRVISLPYSEKLFSALVKCLWKRAVFFLIVQLVVATLGGKLIFSSWFGELLHRKHWLIKHNISHKSQ